MKKVLCLITALVLVFALAVPAMAATTVYFYDTYGDIKSNPSLMWGDKNWGGWVYQPMKDEGGGWFSFDLAAEITVGYNMLIFSNGLPDSDPNCIQWVWNTERGDPNGVYFVADKANPENPPANNYQGVQRDATSFGTKADADALATKLAGGGSSGDGSGTTAAKTGDNTVIWFAFGAFALAGGAVVLITRKVKA